MPVPHNVEGTLRVPVAHMECADYIVIRECNPRWTTHGDGPWGGDCNTAGIALVEEPVDNGGAGGR